MLTIICQVNNITWDADGDAANMLPESCEITFNVPINDYNGDENEKKRLEDDSNVIEAMFEQLSNEYEYCAIACTMTITSVTKHDN